MTKPAGRQHDVQNAARTLLGFDELRPGQLSAIETVLDGRDTLAVMPTGAGKSAIYQIAGHLLEGLTIVVSPLIALQQDQVESLAGTHRIRAAELNSTRSGAERDEIAERLGMKTPKVFVHGFDRPNIRLAVETFLEEDVKRAALLDRVNEHTGPGIIYAATRRDT